MSLTGPTLLTVLVVLALGLPVLLAVLVHRRRPHGPLAVSGVVALVLLSQVVAIGAAGVGANNSFGFYNSWSDLLGRQTPPAATATANGLVPRDGSQGTLTSLSVGLTGPNGRPGSRLPVLVWLPKQYGDPQYQQTRFPVLLMLPGQPGTPQGVFRQFAFGRQATAAIDAQQTRPFVAVFAPIMIAPPRDTECTDVRNGPQAESWLSSDVRTAVVDHFRVSAAPSQWSTMGWSTGGLCAAKLLFRHRNLFGAAVGLGAYYDAATDKTTGNLYGKDPAFRDANSPIWLAGHTRTQRTNLLIVTSREDHESWDGAAYADSRQMIAATAGLPGVATIVLPQGGHNYHLYRSTLPAAFRWLAQTGAL